MDNLLKSYLDNYNKTDDNESLELEVKFGTKDRKKITRIDYENVIKKLLSSGFNTSSEEYLLRITCETINEITGNSSFSDIRTEINGIGNISEYCKNNKLFTDQMVIDRNFVKKKPFTKNEDDINKVDYTDFNFRVSLANEIKLNEENKEVINLIDDWNNKKKIFRYLIRHTLTHKNLPLKIDLSIVKQSEMINRRMKPHYNFKESGIL